MVGHDLHPLDFRVALNGHITDDLPQALFYLIHQHTPPILRAPDHMIDTRYVVTMAFFRSEASHVSGEDSVY